MKKEIPYYHNQYKTFTSPFPRNKSNCELIKSATLIDTNDKTNKIFLDVPASLTKSYMKRNTFYFDLKKHKTYNSDKTPQNNSSKKITFNSTCIFSKDHLESMMKFSKDKLENHFKDKPEMRIDKEKVNRLSTKKICPENSECHSKSLIEKILNTKLCLKNDKKNIGTVPE
jgi:hypothetical protein